ncbi:MAG: cytosine permease, partial [Oscillospiraceae bacterium]|nr:cytosine permease [Oscillospiraceae bacterium]
MEHKNNQAASYDTAAINRENRQSWVKVLSIWMGLIFSTATMLYGGVLGTFLDLGSALLAILCGTAILAVLSILISNIGADTGLSCYELMKYFLGNVGGRIVSVMFIIVMLGWSGIGVIVVVEMLALYIPFFGTPLGFALGGIGLNIIFVGTVWTSFKGLSFFSRLAVPVIALCFLIAILRTVQVYRITHFFEKPPINPSSY